MAGAKKGTRRSGSKPTKAASKANIPGWLWLVVGIAIGGFSMMLLELAPNVGVMPQIGASSTPDGKEPEPKGPVFDFYTLLPESEVVVPTTADETSPKSSSAAAPKAVTKKPVVEARPVKKEPRPTVSQSAPSGSSFLLQAGSFRNEQDAERLRAQLGLAGFSAKLEAVTVRGGERWYRVQLGPFNSESAVTSARKQLASHGLETMLLRQK